MSHSIHEDAKDTVDGALGAGTVDQVEGRIREAVGHGQKAVGDAIGNDDLRAQGSTTELKGKAQQVGGLLQEKAQEIGEQVREGYRDGVENAKASAGEALDRLKHGLARDNETTGEETPEP